jgi:hypothetical protein
VRRLLVVAAATFLLTALVVLAVEVAAAEIALRKRFG